MSKKLLIVDDEPNIVLSLPFLREEAGYNVRAVGDGEAALNALGQEAPDLAYPTSHCPNGTAAGKSTIG